MDNKTLNTLQQAERIVQLYQEQVIDAAKTGIAPSVDEVVAMQCKELLIDFAKTGVLPETHLSFIDVDA